MKSLSCLTATVIMKLICIIVLFMSLALVSSKDLAKSGTTHVVIGASVSEGSSSCAADCAFERVVGESVAMDNALSMMLCSSLGEALLKVSEDIFQ